MCLKIVMYSLLGQPGFCLIFILNKNIIFNLGHHWNASFISFPGWIWSRYSEIKKFKTSKVIFPEITKTHWKMQVSKATPSIIMLFTSLDFLCKNSLNTKVLKQNETEIKKLQTKVVDTMIFGIHCNTFFQETPRFPKFSAKKSYEKA